MAKMKTCKHCLYFNELDDTPDGESVGICRRYPPTQVIRDTDPIEAWPVVHIEDWCGELKIKKELDKQKK